MARMFGTDGVRGVAGTELTIELAMKLGQAGAYVLTKEQSHQPTIIIGCDTRISGGMLANALMAGICSVGANAIFVGVAPTPAIAYLTRKHKVDAGVVISASHNPMEFNGIKFFNGDGYKLSDQLEDEIEALIRNDMEDVVFPIVHSFVSFGRYFSGMESIESITHFSCKRSTSPVRKVRPLCPPNFPSIKVELLPMIFGISNPPATKR